MNDAPSREVVLFGEALQLPAGERAAYLGRACGGDAELHGRVEQLLQANDQAGDFLEQPPDDTRECRPAAPVGEKIGDRIAGYKLLQQIGEGGCGVVYLAEQEVPVRRRVALKIIKPGMDTRSVIARFEAERQALALMDHPNIAKVFDAGATESGRPFFVMELIRGSKITDYCDQNSLTTEERLRLFIQVCQAIQHAHQKGVIHRDIKPSNILVTATLEGAALPIVIDFGIAKATANQRLTDKTVFTEFRMFIGTPAYMSPEQAAQTSVDADTRTDIYSLGVLLYELLTGTTPFDAGALLKAGLDEIRRVIREDEPVRPSTRLSRLAGADLTTVALHRRSEPPTLIRTVSGDLDWIAMKALEKDRTRRYETANGLALDVQRFLANETISARPASRLYKFQKAASRNKLLFSGIGVIAVLLIASLAVVSASLAKERQSYREADAARRRADADREKAVAETAKSRQVTKFLEEMLQGVGPSVARGRDTAMLREILENTAARVGGELTNQPAVQVEMRNLIGHIYQELGLHEKAEDIYRVALDEYRGKFGSENQMVAGLLDNLAGARLQQFKVDSVEAMIREALAIQHRLFGAEHAEVAASLKHLAGLYWRQNRFAEAEILNRESLAMRRKLLGPENLDVADSLNFLALMLGHDGQFAGAVAAEREVLAMRRKILGDEHTLVATTTLNLGITLDQDGRVADAIVEGRRALALRRKLMGDNHPDVAMCLGYLGVWYQKTGNLGEAEAALRETVSIQRGFPATGDHNLFLSMQNLGSVLEQRGKLDEAETWNREVLKLRLTAQGGEHPDVGAAEASLARILSSEGKLAEAATVYGTAFAVQRKNLGDDNPQVAGALGGLVSALMGQGKPDEAERFLNGILTPEEMTRPQCANFLNVRAGCLARRRRWKEGATDASAAVDFQPANHENYHTLAPLLVMSRDSDGYRRLCARIVPRFGGTADAYVADQMAKDCLLLPTSGADFARVGKMAGVAVTAGKDHAALPLFQGCKALAEYRLGHFAEAVEWSEKAVASPLVYARAQAYPVLAMARHQLGRSDGARAALEGGAALARNKLPGRNSIDLGGDWQGWVFAQTLLDEATALIAPVREPGNDEWKK